MFANVSNSTIIKIETGSRARAVVTSVGVAQPSDNEGCSAVIDWLLYAAVKECKRSVAWFKKTQCFYIATVSFDASVYYVKFTCVLVRTMVCLRVRDSELLKTKSDKSYPCNSSTC